MQGVSQHTLTMMRVVRISDSMRGSTPGRTLGGAKATPLGATMSLRRSIAASICLKVWVSDRVSDKCL